MARGESNNLQHTMPLASVTHSGHVPRLIRSTASRWRSLILLTEALLLVSAVFLAVYLRFITHADPLQTYAAISVQFVRATLFAVMMMLGMTAMGMYQTHLRDTWFGAVARQAVAFLLGTFGLLVLYYIVPPVEIGRGVLALALTIGFLMIAVFRLLSARLVDVDALKQRVLVIGAGERAALIEQRLRRRADRRGFCLIGYVSYGSEAPAVDADKLLTLGVPLHQWAVAHQIDEIVFGPDDRRGDVPMEDLLQCRQVGIKIIDLVSFFEREAGKIKLALVDPSWLVFSGGFDSSPVRVLSKRGFDIFMSVAVLALTWPLLILVAAAIWIESGQGQPILYRQQRVGLLGKTFHLVKFRSMRTDAEKDGVARWAGANDCRVTRVGRIIRRTRLDELPQLWNILRGDMSIVGPRPERPEFVADLDGCLRYYSLRHCVRPGLAGWAQLRYAYGASKEDAEEKLKYDLFYVKNHNLLFDLLILVQTLEVVIFGRGVR
ncbi:TIGR03013 family XrtA/PEP-CTERM system glycosyltransferase [Luteimonas terricola]|uniref:Glycosyl transferase n=1 Tax=Luteimonas terricola TaxID=645597 RepID=A0ABQ2EHL9_9GAMM|nr:TIGR03013 family XrtA/PEP-CTERM system glycosyltransferase [Luteimonas terricola]GGK08936.1 glycosyl transferase [Luteimonas terricola]